MLNIKWMLQHYYKLYHNKYKNGSENIYTHTRMCTTNTSSSTAFDIGCSIASSYNYNVREAVLTACRRNVGPGTGVEALPVGQAALTGPHAKTGRSAE